MTICLEKSCSFGVLCVSFVKGYQFAYVLLSRLVLRVGCGIVFIPDHCLSTLYVIT